jgi:hypothetical protein
MFNTAWAPVFMSLGIFIREKTATIAGKRLQARLLSAGKENDKGKN